MLTCTLLLAFGCGKPADVVLITVDTLRQDQVGVYGGSSANTPHIDRLAWEGTLFEHAAAPMPLTRPTHASLLTGRYPREHGVVNNALALPQGSETLAGILRGAGYRTAAFVSVSLLANAGLDQGFEIFEAPTRPRLRDADETVPLALRWLSGLGGREPFFLWIHVFDPHLPYAPPPEHRRRTDPELTRELPAVSWPVLEQVAREHGGDIPAPVLDHARALYRGEVSYTDEWIGNLIEGIGEVRPLAETLIVFTADHGECFEDGVYFEHSDCLGEGALRVPLIIRYPPAFEQGVRVAIQASSIDVPATVLTALGLPVPSGYSGVPLQKLGAASDRYVLVQHPLYQEGAAFEQRAKRHEVIRSVAGDAVQPLLVDSQRVGVVGAGWKYLRGNDSDELYALGSSAESPVPGPDEAAVRAKLGAELDRQLQAHPLTVLDAGQINPELREALRALGYLSEAESPGEGAAEAPSVGSDED